MINFFAKFYKPAESGFNASLNLSQLLKVMRLHYVRMLGMLVKSNNGVKFAEA
jgi:hypothetical protein